MKKVGCFLLLCFSVASLLAKVTIVPMGGFGWKQISSLAAKYLPIDPVIVEAGAYDGGDAVRLSKKWPKATIHSFEPDPRNYIRLKQRVADIKNIFIYEAALSDNDGFALFHQSVDPDWAHNFQSGSLLEPKDHLKYSNVTFPSALEVKTWTIDTWAKKNDIDHVDFLWLDMQGAELNAIKAGPKILKTVKAIYTEVEFVEAYKGQFLYKDVKQWLEKEGFVMIAKDFSGKEKKRWYGNILMVRK